MVSDSRSAGRPLEHLDVERLLGDDLFQAAVLILDLLHRCISPSSIAPYFAFQP
jgi:hypothetical protein